ncbi:Putative glucose-6-phosphate 1-epimerase [Thalassocella blandensis]|nr:Putative glucose-6-phosphate 1-epimerase [Thalassocella blandensis]
MQQTLTQQVAELKQRFVENEEVSFFINDELIGLRVDNPFATAIILLQGAQLLEFTPRDKARLIWCSEAVEYKQGKPLRGGIPICWPWFGPLKNNVEAITLQVHAEQAPQHGFARSQDWHLESITTSRLGTTKLVFTLTDNEISRAYFDKSFALQLSFTIGESLDVALTVKNTGDSELSFTGALHSYFAVSDINKTRIFGLDNLPFIDSVNADESAVQSGALDITQETDRIYFAPEIREAQELHDPLTQTTHLEIAREPCSDLLVKCPERKIKIRSRGSKSAIVWNPWIEKSRGLSQFKDDEYLEMLCVETANAHLDFITLAPQHEHVLAASIAYAN